MVSSNLSVDEKHFNPLANKHDVIYERSQTLTFDLKIYNRDFIESDSKEEIYLNERNIISSSLVN